MHLRGGGCSCTHEKGGVWNKLSNEWGILLPPSEGVVLLDENNNVKSQRLVIFEFLDVIFFRIYRLESWNTHDALIKHTSTCTGTTEYQSLEII